MAAELQIGTVIRVVGEPRDLVIITPKSGAGIYGVLSPDGYFSSHNERSIMSTVEVRELTPVEAELSRNYSTAWDTRPKTKKGRR